jgi:hypothetical protein
VTPEVTVKGKVSSLRFPTTLFSFENLGISGKEEIEKKMSGATSNQARAELG